MNFLKRYLAAVDQMNKLLGFLLFAILAAVLISLSLQVLTRYVIEKPFGWTEELSRYLMVWMTFIGASLAVRHHRLIRVEVLVMKMTAKQRKYVYIFAGLVSILFYLLLIYFGFQIISILSLQRSPALQLPMYIPYLSVPVGGLFMVLNTIAALIEIHFSVEEGAGSG